MVYEHLATKTMRFNGYLGNSPARPDPIFLLIQILRLFK
ncbi:hypothetical protein D3OALGA1CA_4614 [Olavius algarvensis associated proteobacterium Delta 3]|nr:hypothetical protein D3OALGB2SA_2599 [Olavius algarvensis associated proteobacterium Delta 3]CAB5154196.1 hypothetical protein D3OALGA1CA_4614 [Olavius algarvensis associated proteobacterium Delta 3]